MKKETIGETSFQEAMKKIEENTVRKSAIVRIEHFVIKNGVAIPWNIAMDKVMTDEWLNSELKKEEAKVKVLEKARNKRMRDDIMVILFSIAAITLFLCAMSNTQI